jgi:hypothetical protein
MSTPPAPLLHAKHDPLAVRIEHGIESGENPLTEDALKIRHAAG